MPVNADETKLLLNQKITKILNVKTYNLLNYKKHKHPQKSVLEKWDILTNLLSPEKIKKIYIAILFYSWQKSHCFLGNRE